MAALPDPVRTPVEAALRALGHGQRISRATPVSGGCIHNGVRLETDRDPWFLKWSSSAPDGMFAAEADGLLALRSTGAVRVPEPVAWRDGEAGAPSWLLLEWVEPGPDTPRSFATMGEGLARIHRSRAEPGYGWARDNWIGTLAQANPGKRSWGVFWRDARLAPQLEISRGAGRLHGTRFDRLLELVPSALAHVRTPELIHGDLWSGNAYTSESGDPVLVDPAVYRGDGEVDLAMTELFGGFPADFYAAYRAARPVSDEYQAYAKDLYQLYYLLVHVNLFGTSYEAPALAAAEAVLAALG